MGTEKVGVIDVLGELVLVRVCVTRGEEVAVMSEVGALDVREGVKTACNVSAAAV
jgi:hypothetical protein